MKTQKIRWNQETNECFLETLEDGVLTVELVTSEEASRLTAEMGGY